jgi:hypothetical protein
VNEKIKARCYGHYPPESSMTGDFSHDLETSREFHEVHEFTLDQMVTFAEWLSSDDWEDGPRCLLDILAWEEREGGQ